MVGCLLALLLQSDVERDVARLGDPDIEVRDDASRRLRAAGLRAVTILRTCLDAPDTEIRVRAAQLLDAIAAALPPCALELRLVSVKGRAFVNVRNPTPVRVRLHRRSLGVRLPAAPDAPLIALDAGEGDDPFVAVEGGDSLALAVPWLMPEGPGPDRRNLRVAPGFAFSREGKPGAETAMQGIATGEAVEFSWAVECEIPKIYELRRASPETVVRLLKQVFPADARSVLQPPKFSVARSSRCVLAVGGAVDLEVVGPLVDALDFER